MAGSFPMQGFILLLSMFLSSVCLPCSGGEFVPPNSTWRYFKGTSEASSPVTAWRQRSFNDSAWLQGQAGFYYENNPGSGTAVTGNTVLSDMQGGYTCIFMRRTFVVTNVNDVAAIQVAAWSDDGFIAWINGAEVGRFNMPSGEVNYNDVSSPALEEPVPWWTNSLSNVQSLLVPGTNILAVQAFNAELSSSSDFVINPALYWLPDLTGPPLATVYPTAGSEVRELTAVEVNFSKPVTGVNASDLLIDGSPAISLEQVTSSQFVFSFPQPPTGSVQVAWAPGHGITDLTSASNAFGGGNWSYTLDTNLPTQAVIISEFMASNSGDQPNSVHDELGNSPDWIELYNGESAPVALDGWSLTDNPSQPAKWVFPPTVIPANGYLVIFASGRNTNVNGQLHTNFKISASPGFLGLFDALGNLLSAFAPTYPPQYTDISYGRDRLDPSLTGYFTNSTPGAANATRGAGFGPDVQFSRAGGTFLNNFSLVLTTADTNCDIRYVVLTTNLPSGTTAITNIPTAIATLYTGPIAMTNTAQVRARAFPRQAGLWPGEPHTESFVKISSAAAGFTSDLPVILLHNMAGGEPAYNGYNSVYRPDQSVIVMLFEPVNGVTSLTNPPTLVERGGFNIRGKSTPLVAPGQYNLSLEIWDEYNQDKKVEFLGMPAESDWVLGTQDYFDPGYMHNTFAMQLCRDMGRYASRTRYAEMFLNISGGTVTYTAPAGGNYFGLYTIMEKIKRGGDRVNIEKLAPWMTNVSTITGGYMLANDWPRDNDRTFHDAYTGKNIIYVEPNGLEMVTTARQAQRNYITNYIAQLGAALDSSSFTNPATGYAAYIDVDSWIDNHILCAFTFSVDAFRWSSYFYKDRDKKIEMGPPWDFDRALGVYYDSGDRDTRGWNPRVWIQATDGEYGTDYFSSQAVKNGSDSFGNPNFYANWWLKRVFTDPDFWQRWIDRWTELRRSTFDTNHLFAIVTNLSSQLTQAQPREVSRWDAEDDISPRSGAKTANGYSYSFPGTYQGEVNFLKQWLADRADFIDTNFLRPPVFSSNGGPITPGFNLTITAPTIEPNTTIYYTLNGADPRLPGGAINPAAFSHVGTVNLTLTNNARVFARNYNAAHNNPYGSFGLPVLSSHWSGPTAATFVAATPPLAITEIMYHPADGPGGGDDGQFEFIELKNVGATTLNLVGMHFTNGIGFTFTATNPITQLGPGQYVVLASDAAAFLSRYPTVTNLAGQYTGRLDNSGERIVLHGACEEPILDFSYNDSWYPTTDGQGFSLVIRNEYAPFGAWGEQGSWRPSAELNGSPGCADGSPPAVPAVVINEALTHTDPPQVDTVELRNLEANPANIGGWFLSDDPGEPAKYRIPDSTVIPAGGYLTFNESQFNSGANSFALSSLGDEIYLFSGNGASLTGYRHGFEFGAQLNGVTLGRYVTSDGKEHFVMEKTNTLGGPNSGPKVGPVVINEIMFEPPPFGLSADNLDEYIELRNITGSPAPLYDPLHPTNTWQIQGAVQYTLPQNVVLAPLSQLLVVSFDPAHDPVMLSWFRSRHGIGPATPIYGPWTGHLDNNGERVALIEPDQPQVPPAANVGYVPEVLVEEIHYSTLPPWPAGADGTGNSLQRIVDASFGDEPLNWQAAPPTPGSSNPGGGMVDSDNDGLPDAWELANGLSPNDPYGINGPDGDRDGDGLSNLQEFWAGTAANNPLDTLRFEYLSLSNGVCRFMFNTHTGQTYTVERVNSFGITDLWAPLTNFVPTSNGPVILSYPQDLNGQFYRLKTLRN